MIHPLTTASVPEQQRLDYWQAICGELIGTFALKDYAPQGFQATFSLADVGSLKIGTFEASCQTLERGSSLIKPSDPDNYIVVLGASHHAINVEHGGRNRSGPSGLFLVDPTKPYATGYPEHLKVIDVFIPRKKLEEIFGTARLAAGLCIEPTQSSFPVLSTFLRSLAEHGGTFDPHLASRMSAIAIDLIAAGFAETMGQAPPQRFGGASILYRAKAYIDDNLGRSSLSMPEIAAAANVSTRRLRQIAAEEELSLSDWLWERRLTRAYALLSNPAFQSMTNVLVAYQCGFADPAHFARRFRERFGQTPMECRLQAMTERGEGSTSRVGSRRLFAAESGR